MVCSTNRDSKIKAWGPTGFWLYQAGTLGSRECCYLGIQLAGWWLQEPVYSHDIINCRDRRGVCHPVGMFTQWNERLMEGGTSVAMVACQDSGLQAQLQSLIHVCGDVMIWTHFPYYWPFVWRIHRLSMDTQYKGPVIQSFWKYFIVFHWEIHLHIRELHVQT